MNPGFAPPLKLRRHAVARVTTFYVTINLPLWYYNSLLHEIPKFFPLKQISGLKMMNIELIIIFNKQKISHVLLL